VYLLKTKHDVFDCFKDFHSFILNQYSAYIKILRSDNDTEYMSKDMSKYLHSNGIMHQTSCVGTPQQNGISERKNRDLLEITRAIMLQMNVPKHFWSRCLAALVSCIYQLLTGIN
jgi:transposase InsO family protein